MASKDQEREAKLLGAAVMYLDKGTTSFTFEQMSTDLGFNFLKKSWRKVYWTLISTKGFITPVVCPPSIWIGDYQLTEKGKEYVSTPEFKDILKELNVAPINNEERQKRIKKSLRNNQAVGIFDLLLNYGSLSVKELALLLTCNRGSHGFSYGLQDLRKKNLVEKGDNDKLYLTDKAFFDQANDRPVPKDLDPCLLQECMAVVESNKLKNKKKSSNKKNAKKPSRKKRKRNEMEE